MRWYSLVCWISTGRRLRKTLGTQPVLLCVRTPILPKHRRCGSITQVIELAGELHFNWDAVEQLFDTTLLDQMFGAYCHALQALVAMPQSWWG